MRCPKCDGKMQTLYVRTKVDKQVKRLKIGEICRNCKVVHLDDGTILCGEPIIEREIVECPVCGEYAYRMRTISIICGKCGFMKVENPSRAYDPYTFIRYKVGEDIWKKFLKRVYDEFGDSEDPLGEAIRSVLKEYVEKC